MRGTSGHEVEAAGHEVTSVPEAAGHEVTSVPEAAGHEVT